MLYDHGATTLQKSLFCIFTLVGLGAALAACGSELPQSTPMTSIPTDAGPDVESPDAGMLDAGEMSCPVGHAPGPDGKCEPIGIQGCAPRFIDPDGVCRPSMAKCADMPGTIPKFDEGCIPVGISNCAPEFIEDDGLCHPRMQKCAGKPGTFAVPQLGCVPIDGPLGCGSGTWGNIVDEPGTVYVDGSYMGGSSDGSQAQPYTTISEAIANVQAGGKVAVAAGVYDENLFIDKSLTLEGRCPSMVKIQGIFSPFDIPTVMIASASDITLRGIQIGGKERGIYISGSKNINMDRIHIVNATEVGITIFGNSTQVNFQNSLVDSTLPTASNNFGYGAYISQGAQMNIIDSAFINNYGAGILVWNSGSYLNISNSLIEATQPRLSDMKSGIGIDLEFGPSASITDCALVGNHSNGIYATGSETAVTAKNNMIEETHPQPADGLGGQGIIVESGTTISLTGNVIYKNWISGISVRNNGTALYSSGNLIWKTEYEGPNPWGIGIAVGEGAYATLENDVIYQNRSLGINVYFKASTFQASGILIEDTRQSSTSDQDGGGLLAYITQGSVTIMSSAFINNTVAGIGIAFSNGAISVSDSLIMGTKLGSFVDEEGMPHEDFGDGLISVSGSNTTVKRVIAEKVGRAGFLFSESGGIIISSESRENRYGVVLQGEPKPDFYSFLNTVRDNIKEDFVMDKAFSIPAPVIGTN